MSTLTVNEATGGVFDSFSQAVISRREIAKVIEKVPTIFFIMVEVRD